MSDAIHTFFEAARASNRPSIDGPWVSPLPTLAGHRPIALERAIVEAIEPDDSLLEHPRILLAYDRADFTDHASTHPAGALGGMLFHFVPRFTPVFAAQAGTIVYAGRTDTGGVITLDHGNGWATHYAKLEHLFAATRPPYSRKRVETVKAGDVLGYAGGTNLRPLRFELWRKLPDDGGLYRAEDPLPRMTEWIHLPLTRAAS
jgi:Peptidase family M23